MQFSQASARNRPLILVSVPLLVLHQVDNLLQGQTLTVLVNNAGVVLPGPLMLQRLEEVRHILDVNLFGTLAVIQAGLLKSALACQLLPSPNATVHKYCMQSLQITLFIAHSAMRPICQLQADFYMFVTWK